MNPTVQNPNTPRYDITSGLLTDYGRSLGLKEVNKPITSSDLQSKQGLQLPKAPTNFESPVVLPVEQKTPAQLEQERLSTQKENESSGIQKLMTLIGTESGKEAKYATEAGADEAQKEYDRYATELTAEQRSVELAKRALSGKGLTQAQIASESEALDRQSIQKQADIAILGNAAKGRFDTAMAIAKRKVESSIRPLQAQLDAKKFVFENNKDLYTKAELSKLDALIKADELKVKKEEDRLTKGNEAIINAMQNKASTVAIEKAKSILSKGGSLAEITAVLGQSAMSPADKLELALKNAQISKIYSEISKTNSEINKTNREAAKIGAVNANGLRSLDDTEYSKFTANPNYKAISDGAKYERALNDFKLAVEKYGTREILSAKGKGALGAAYSTLVATTKDYYTLGSLDAGVEKLVSMGVPPPDKLRIRDKRVISSLETLNKQAKNSINSAKNQLSKSVYGDTVEFESLLQESGLGESQSQEAFWNNVDSALQVTTSPYATAGYDVN